MRWTPKVKVDLYNRHSARSCNPSRGATGFGTVQALAMVLVCLVAVLGALLWKGHGPSTVSTLEGLMGVPARAGGVTAHHPLVELLKLVTAFLIGWLITNVHRKGRPAGLSSPSMEQAQVLLCVSGAMMMILIADSLARAFGIAGAAGIIRFRTPVEDPKEAIILFLLLGLGMACGLGAFAVAGLGAVFLCGVLILQNRTREVPVRSMTLSVAAKADQDPSSHVQEILSQHGLNFEQREVSHGDRVEMKYVVTLEEDTDLDALSRALRNGGTPAIQEVTWERLKKKDR